MSPLTLEDLPEIAKPADVALFVRDHRSGPGPRPLPGTPACPTSRSGAGCATSRPTSWPTWKPAGAAVASMAHKKQPRLGTPLPTGDTTSSTPARIENQIAASDSNGVGRQCSPERTGMAAPTGSLLAAAGVGLRLPRRLAVPLHPTTADGSVG